MDSARRIFLETTVKENMDRYYEAYLKDFEYADYCIDDKTDIVFFKENTESIDSSDLILQLSIEYLGYIGTSKFTLETYNNIAFDPHTRYFELNRREYVFVLDEILNYIDEHFIHGSIMSIGGHF